MVGQQFIRLNHLQSCIFCFTEDRQREVYIFLVVSERKIAQCASGERRSDERQSRETSLPRMRHSPLATHITLIYHTSVTLFCVRSQQIWENIETATLGPRKKSIKGRKKKTSETRVTDCSQSTRMTYLKIKCLHACSFLFFFSSTLVNYWQIIFLMFLWQRRVRAAKVRQIWKLVTKHDLSSV